ncbi:MAG: LD-carboxypeptidase, partial [Proteobacteria bacterium]
MSREVLKPHALNIGDTIGIFTPSSPGYAWNEELFTNGLNNLEKLGFKIKLGALTERRASEGYRSGSPEERASEFMELVRDPNVHALMSTIGGTNSSSLIPFLDFEEIRKQRKIMCGYSDVTSLHAAILKFSGLRTIYGPGVMCWFGEWPDGVPESTEWFLTAAVEHREGLRKVLLPPRWSNHKRNWANDDWKSIPREWQQNDGWHVLNAGVATAPILALNLNTIMSSAGTPYWP